ncbi:MAG: hypothetical protein QUV02_03580 [Maricaulis sp.]|jgi:hypothetical protein|uniref:hypothetical protein n=1 Tax=Maricaulis sp. TaxID=1486257 RepID=UPI001AFF9773|nr:hypothetical protein [Maricaulis sp.]MEC9250597.1 hypothetical protein [Pseudomonadota bacterium]MBO6728751.1 hypothetical protein [Maricaulis sp.]MBO6847812.1 hypothetical protein [Maricaulis sp.]MBO6877435.1 hypothetical protein [Maricaulis sp.]MDM7983501.1 hypothetical protein [Maricaulis sp.]
MKKLIAGAAVALLAAAPAFAGEMVIELTRSSGESFTLVLDTTAGTASVNGSTPESYTWDEGTNQLCASSGLCVTFAEASQEVGSSTTYTTNEGNSGTATLVSYSE